MKGLTAAEYEMLLNASKPCAGPSSVREATSTERSIFADLIEQGRVELVECSRHPDCWSMWWITPAGREALQLYRALQEAGLAA